MVERGSLEGVECEEEDDTRGGDCEPDGEGGEETGENGESDLESKLDSLSVESSDAAH